MTERGLGRAALGGVASTVLWQGIRLVLLVISITVLARLLDPRDYGLVAMVTAIIGIGELLRDMGLSMAAVQAKHLSPGEKNNLFWVNVAVGTALTATTFLLAGPIASLYGQPALEPIAQALSFTFVINGIATQFKAQINRDLRFTILGIGEALPQAIGLGVAIWYATQIGGYFSLVVQALVVAGGSLVFNSALARWWPGLIDRQGSIRRLLGFGGALVGTQTLAYVSKNLDTVLLGLTAGSTQLGFYNRAYQVTVLPLTQITAPMSRVAIPVLSRMKDDTASFMRYLRAGQFFSVTLTSTIYGFAIGLAPSLVEIVLGSRWLPAAPIIQALALSGIFRAAGQVPYWLFLAQGHAGKQFRFYLVAQPIVIVGILAGLPYGPVGVAVGLSAGYGVFWIAQMFWASRATATPTRGLTRSALVIVLSIGGPITLIAYLSERLAADAPAAALIGAAFTLSYLAGMLLLIPAYRAQLRVVWRLIKK